MRFHVQSLDQSELKLDKPQSRHAVKVLRLKRGDIITLFDGTGREAQACIEDIGAFVSTRILRIEEVSRESSIEITCASALPKGDRLDFMIQKLCEIGVARFIPVKFTRSVSELSNAKLDRLKKISTETCKQCGRNRPMLIEHEQKFCDFVNNYPAALLCSTKNCEPLLSKASGMTITYLIGPEGGLTAEEDGAQLVHTSLGSSILRIETAAIYTASAISAYSQLRNQQVSS